MRDLNAVNCVALRPTLPASSVSIVLKRPPAKPVTEPSIRS
jgi:hypothetical protein